MCTVGNKIKGKRKVWATIILGGVLATSLATGCMGQNTNPWETLGTKNDYSFQERVERGEFQHLAGFQEGSTSLEMVYDFNLDQFPVKTLEGKESSFGQTVKKNNLPTIVVVNTGTSADLSQAIEKMILPAWNKEAFNVVHLILDESEEMEETKKLIRGGNADFYKHVGIIDTVGIRRIGLEFTPAILYVNSNNVIKNIGLPNNNLETLVLLGMAEGTIQINKEQIFTYQSSVDAVMTDKYGNEGPEKDEGEGTDIAEPSKPIAVPDPVEYGADTKGLANDREQGKFTHIEQDQDLMDFMKDNYGINMYKQTVEDEKGNHVLIGDTVVDKNLPTIITFGRNT